jgi:cell division cycle 2-like protein
MKRRDRWADESDSDGGAKARKRAAKSSSAAAKSRSKAAAAAAAADAPAAAEVVPPVSAPPAKRQYVPVLHGCRSVDCYARLNHIDEGTYGVVFRAKDKETGEVFALKQVRWCLTCALQLRLPSCLWRLSEPV